MNLSLLNVALLPHSWTGPTGRVDWRLVSAAAVLALCIGLAIAWTLDRIEEQVRGQVAESLQTVVATTRAGIMLWIDDLEAEIAAVAQRPEVVSAVLHELQFRRSEESGVALPSDVAAVLTSILSLYEHIAFAVIAPDGAQIAWSGTAPVEGSDERAVRSAFNGEVSVRLAPDPAHVPRSLTAAAPVRDRAQNIVAVLVLLLDPTEGLADLTRLGRLGSTGETYIFDRNGKQLTESRFPPAKAAAAPFASRLDEPPRKNPSPRIMEIARAGRAEPGAGRYTINVDVDGYPDYRGVDVLGAWAWTSNLDVGIATELDRSEALSPYRTVRALTLSMLTAIALSVAALLGMLVGRGRMLATNFAFREAAKARREALAMVSHDLRSPLNSVLLCSNMLSAGCDQPTASRAAAIIKRSGARMESLIADLLDVSEMEDGRFRIEPRLTQVRALLDDVQTGFVELARGKSIELTVNCSDDVRAIHVDPGRLAQVLANLVGNALKFTPAGGTVSLHATVSEAEVRFEVRDTGPGISEADLPRLFDQFWKGATTEGGGRGLGLYIAKKLVECHGGGIWVETGRQTGTSFFFTIPLNGAGAAAR